jgi:hypothetical protein
MLIGNVMDSVLADFLSTYRMVLRRTAKTAVQSKRPPQFRDAFVILPLNTRKRKDFQMSFRRLNVAFD